MVLCVRQDIDLRGAALAVVVMVVVLAVAVVMDGLTGNVAQHPDEVPAPVIVTGVDAEAHVCEDIGDGHQQAEDMSGSLFHPCKNKDYCVYLQNTM